jgi:CysZ protein
MTSFLLGLSYHFKGLRFTLGSPKLVMLGLARLAILIVITIAAAAVILTNYQQILTFMWNEPQNPWIAWLWQVVSWLMALILLAISAVVGFVVAQFLFSVLIMDMMSQITERKVSGQASSAATNMPWYIYLLYLLRQEIPRAVLPVSVSLLLLVLGWFTPLGPLLTIFTPLAASLFLAWDNTDLVPARRLVSLSQRFAFLRRHLPFHLGFGLLFLIPGLNIILLPFAPVGATLFYVEQIDKPTAAGGPRQGYTANTP